MKFAKVVFWIAGAWGVLVISPLFFMMDWIGRQTPPPVTHPEFYYGFAVVTLMWQAAFFVIATDPARHRALMIPPALAKFGYTAIIFTLHMQGRVPDNQLLFALVDFVLAALFLVAFFRVKTNTEERHLRRG
jgi:hypothetical protein